MRRIFRCALVALLALALTASGSVLGFASHAAAHGMATYASHDAVSHDVHAQHHHGAPQDEAPPQDYVSKTCCSMCTVTSPLPPFVTSAVQFETSPAEYAARVACGIAVKLAVDPGIPKRIG